MKRQCNKPEQLFPPQLPRQVQEAVPFTLTEHVPPFSQGLFIQGDTKNKKRCLTNYKKSSEVYTVYNLKLCYLVYFFMFSHK